MEKYYIVKQVSEAKAKNVQALQHELEAFIENMELEMA